MFSNNLLKNVTQETSKFLQLWSETEKWPKGRSINKCKLFVHLGNSKFSHFPRVSAEERGGTGGGAGDHRMSLM